MNEKELNLRLEKIEKILCLFQSKADINTSKVELIDAKLHHQKIELELKLTNEINYIWKELIQGKKNIKLLIDKVIEIQKERFPLEFGEIEEEKTIH